jgi:uncharacterized membrane protein YoaK (UPF0700 family)
VFANAQTGNVVLFGARAAAGNWNLGVALARLLRVRPQKQTLRATLICQVLKLLVLLVLLFFGRFVPDLYGVPLIGFSGVASAAKITRLWVSII